MSERSDQATKAGAGQPASRVPTMSRWLCLGGAAFGVLGLLGWLTRSAPLYTLVPGQPAMMPNTAVALALLGLVGVVLGRGRPHRFALVLCCVAALVLLALGLGTLIEYAFAVDLHIDQILLRSTLGPSPGRPSPLTALAFTLLASAILLFDTRPTAYTRPSEWLLISAALTALVGITGQVLGTGVVYRLPRTPVIGMAVPTAVSLLLSSVGLLLARPAAGIMAIARSDGPGGTMLRRLATPYVIAPMVLGFGVTRLFAVIDVNDFPLVVAFVAVGVTAVGLAILVVTARLLARANAALEESQASTREIIALASDGIFITDATGRFQEVNEAGCRLLGLAEAEIVGRRILDFIPPDEAPRLAASRAAMLEGRSEISEWHLRHRSGRYIPVEVSASIRPGGQWQGFVRDITQRKAAEELARRTQARDHVLAAVGLLLASSLDRKQVVREAAELLVRKFADACVIDLVEDPAHDGAVTRLAVVHRDPRKAETARALQGIALDRRRPHLASVPLQSRRAVLIPDVTTEYLDSISQTVEHRRLLGELAPVSLISVPLEARGMLLGMLTFVSSDPRRHYDESDLSFAQEIAHRLALSIDNARLFETATMAITARDEVLRIVAHDLRNPLSVILMQASLQLETSGRESPEGASAATIATAAKRMNRLIRDLLDVTKSEVGRLSVERAPVSASAVIRDAVAAQRIVASEASLTLGTELPSDPGEVNGDRDRLLQIFENLIGNAIRFTPAGGHIEVGAQRREHEVLFWVKDTGSGIAAEDLPHVFDRFWQAKKGGGGAGLGLSIVKALVDAHGGRVWVESRSTGGSCFFFTIPVAETPARAPERNEPTRPQMAAVRPTA